MPDPRAKHTAEDRKAQFDLAMKLYAQLGEMTYRRRPDQRRCAPTSRTARASCPPAIRSPSASARRPTDADALRQKIVATKEGGMITGEERLREYLTDLYGERRTSTKAARPQTQVERADALSRELADVVAEFDAWVAQGPARDQPGAGHQRSGEDRPSHARGLGDAEGVLIL